jgi:predicted dienelactone hydrolase
LENLLLRIKDVVVVLDQLQRWNGQSGHALYGRLDLKHIGMSGHSFGAITTQAVSGQVARGGKAVFTDPRIKAAIAFSPNSPAAGTAKEAFGEVKIPWMLMTGTKDIVPMLNTKIDMKSRLAVFPALPSGGKYEVVLDRAEHSAFMDRPLPSDTEPRNPNHHRVILALSTAFWDAYLKDDAAAKAWLDGDGPKSVLEEKDHWQRK